MSRLNRFMRRPEILEFQVEDEKGNPVTEKIKVSPLKLKDQHLVVELTGGSGMEAGAIAVKKVLKKILSENDITDYTDAELLEVDWEFIDPMLSAVIKIDSVKLEDAKQKFVESMRQKQEASKEKKKKQGTTAETVTKLVTGS